MSDSAAVAGASAEELPRRQTLVADSIRWWGFPFRDDDIVICTPPKSGTTWMQTICALLLVGDEALDGRISTYSPWLDMRTKALEETLATLAAQQHRRFIKTHTSLAGLPKHPGVTWVCVGRDPRDVHFSWAGHIRNMNLPAIFAAIKAVEPSAELPPLPAEPPSYDPAATFAEWIDRTDPEGVWYILLPEIVAQLRGFWESRTEPGVVLFHYEDMLRDLPGEVRRLADALGLDVSDERVNAIAALAEFRSMKQRADGAAPNTDVGIWHDNASFFKTGRSGQWRDVVPAELLHRYDDRIAELVDPDLARWMHSGRTASLAGDGANG